MSNCLTVVRRNQSSSSNNSPKCMIKIFIESDKFSHKAGVTKHATNTLARKSANCRQC